MANRYPIDGYLQNDLVANSKKITGIRATTFDSSASTVLGMVKDVFIAIRTDGVAGSGLETDPLDGSTAVKLDAIFLSYAAITNIHFHLGPGIFKTDVIARSWAPKSGWSITGRGMYVTTIQAVGSATTQNLFVIGEDDNTTNISGVVISDLTVDANSSIVGATATVGAGSEKNYKIGLINIGGSNNLIEHVRGINQYSSLANNRESFGIRLYGANISASVTGDIVRNCLVESPAGTYNTPYALHGYSDTYPITNWRFEGNRAYGNNTGLNDTSGFQTGGLNLAYSGNGFVIGNRFIDCFSILYIDTGGISDVFITGNKITRGAYGVGITLNGAAVATNINISNNDFNIQNKITGGASYGIIVGGGAERSHFTIHNNHVVRDSSGTGYVEVKPIGGAFTGTTTIIKGNVTDNCFASVVSGATFLNNRDATGVQSVGLEDNPAFALAGTNTDITSIRGDIRDNNGVLILQRVTTASAVNYVSLSNGATLGSGGPIIRSAGSETNVPMTMYAKGTGSIFLGADRVSFNGLSGANGTIALPSSNDAAAPNSSFYYSTTQSYPVYKDSGGTVRQLKATVAGGTIDSTTALLKGDNAGNAVAATQTGTGNAVLQTSPTLTTPTLGVASATSLNKWVLTAPSTAATLVAGADSLTYTFPAISCNIGFREIPQNSQSTSYTTVLTDNGKEIFHPVADNNARTFTIAANASVAYNIGTVLVFTNMAVASLSVAITSDTLTLLGAGTTGTRTVAQYGQLIARKITSTSWVCFGINVS